MENISDSSVPRRTSSLTASDASSSVVASKAPMFEKVMEPVVDALVEAFTDALVKGLESVLNEAIDAIAKYVDAAGKADGFDPAPVLRAAPRTQASPTTAESVSSKPLTGGASAQLGGTSVKGNDNLSGFANNKYDALIREMSAKYKVPARLIKSVIEQESRFIPTAGSPVGARGLMQLMPGTARELGVKNPLDPRQSIEGGTKYLARMLKMFKGDVPRALAAYNAGPGNVIKYRGIPPFRETQKYVRNIMARYNKG